MLNYRNISLDDLKKILLKDPLVTNIDDITTTTEGRLKIKIGSTFFDSFFVKSKCKSKKLYVFLSAVGIYRNSNVVFHRISWFKNISDNCLFIDDPGRIIYKFAPSFYFGTDKEVNNSYLDYIKRIVIKFCELYGITTSNIFFISSSNGGGLQLLNYRLR